MTNLEPAAVTLVLRRVNNDAATDQIITEDVDYEHGATIDPLTPAALFEACENWVAELSPPPGRYFVEARELLGTGSGELLADSECVEVAP